MKLKLNNVRLAFPALFEPKKVNGEGTAAYSACFIIDPADPQVATLNQAIEQIAKDKWGVKAAGLLKTMRAGDKVALRDGDRKADYDGFAGHLYVSARNTARVMVIDRNRTPLTEADGRPYAGCFVNALIELWVQDNNYGKRINAGLSGVQFCGDGEPFTGRGVASTEDFEDLGQVEEEFDFS